MSSNVSEGMPVSVGVTVEPAGIGLVVDMLVSVRKIVSS